MGLIVLCGIALIIATACHYWINRYLLASLIAAVLTITCFVIISYIELGHHDKFILIAVGCGGTYAFLVSLVVGAPFAICRRRHQPKVGCCSNCNYNLTGNTTGICPECGAPISVETKTLLGQASTEDESRH